MNDNECPYCKSEQISASPFESDTNVAWQVVDCAVCEREWKWTYKLEGVELLYEPKKGDVRP